MFLYVQNTSDFKCIFFASYLIAFKSLCIFRRKSANHLAKAGVLETVSVLHINVSYPFLPENPAVRETLAYQMRNTKEFIRWIFYEFQGHDARPVGALRTISQDMYNVF